MLFFFFFNDTATTEIYTLSLHDALPIFSPQFARVRTTAWVFPFYSSRWRDVFTYAQVQAEYMPQWRVRPYISRSEEHTSELQSRQYLVCRLLLEKKKKKTQKP